MKYIKLDDDSIVNLDNIDYIERMPDAYRYYISFGKGSYITITKEQYKQVCKELRKNNKLAWEDRNK